MITLKQFISDLETIPATTSWYLADLRQKCPGVGIDMIRRVMKDLQGQKVIECLGRGRNAKWHRTGN